MHGVDIPGFWYSFREAKTANTIYANGSLASLIETILIYVVVAHLLTLFHTQRVITTSLTVLLKICDALLVSELMVATAMMTLRLEQEGQLHFSFLHC